jgi:hypothetical protein
MYPKWVRPSVRVRSGVFCVVADDVGGDGRGCCWRCWYCMGRVGACVFCAQAVTGMSAWQTMLGVLRAPGGARNLYAGVLSPCSSVGLWKATTLGLNYNLMQWAAEWQGFNIARRKSGGSSSSDAAAEGKSDERADAVGLLPFWQVRVCRRRRWWREWRWQFFRRHSNTQPAFAPENDKTSRRQGLLARARTTHAHTQLHSGARFSRHIHVHECTRARRRIASNLQRQDRRHIVDCGVNRDGAVRAVRTAEVARDGGGARVSRRRRGHVSAAPRTSPRGGRALLLLLAVGDR